jgi:glycosyltransferase involved in cell wall biosynthesis
MLDDITPVVLTLNEAPNIARTLKCLTWARDVVVVDSGSTDGTLDVLSSLPNVRLFRRAFDTHGNQWRYAVDETGISTAWVLRLDADYQVTRELTKELRNLRPDAEVSAYRVAFDYAVFSKKLRSSLYPANTILLRRGRFDVRDRGHTEVWHVEGKVETLQSRVVHDDWKPVEAWLGAQARYMRLEAERLGMKDGGLKRALRLLPPLMPLGVFLYGLFGKGLILDGRAGMFYALQRLVAEAILSLMVLERRLGKSDEFGERQ